MTMDFQPTLTGPTLTLRPVEQGDWSALYAAASDPLVWEVHPVNDRWQEPVFRKFFEEGLASGGMLVAVDKASGAIIGSSRYSTEFAQAGEIEIGWTFLSRQYWGGFSNREMKHLMLPHAFGSYDSVIFRIGETNGRSRRAVEKIGGKLLERRQVMQLPDRQAVHVVYAIKREDFTGLL